MNSTANRLLIHMGMHKTGTTSIQTFFSGFRDTISASGLHYPISGCVGVEAAHHNIYRFYTQNAEEKSRFNAALGGGAELIDEIRHLNADVLLSSEAFWVLARDEPQRFVDFVSEVKQDRKVVFLITWRNAAEYCESLYFQNAKERQMVRIDTAVRWFFSMPAEFERIVSLVSTTTDADTIILQYGKDMIGRFLSMFSDSLKINIDGNLDRHKEVNVSLSPAQKLIAAHLSLANIKLEPEIYKGIIDAFRYDVSDHTSVEQGSIMSESLQKKLIEMSVQGLRNAIEKNRRVFLYPQLIPDQLSIKQCILGNMEVFTFPKLRSVLEAIQ